MTDITINPAPAPAPTPAYPVLDAQDRDEDLDNYETTDMQRVRQLAAENTQLREAVEALQRQADNNLAGSGNDADRYQQATEEVARLRDAVEAQADTITAMEEEAKDRELFIEQLYGVADVLIHGRRRR